MNWTTLKSNNLQINSLYRSKAYNKIVINWHKVYWFFITLYTLHIADAIEFIWTKYLKIYFLSAKLNL